MIALIIGMLVSLIVTLVGTPLLIRLVHKLHYGQYIRQDGPQSHLVKRGTPTLGGVVINFAILLGWASSALYRYLRSGDVPSWSAALVLFAMLSMGLLGFIDDFAKVRKKQNEGLSVGGKFIGQFIFATIYAVSDPLDLTVIAVCAAVACFGFLWYNSNPASIFMGDTGSLALGGLFAALSIATHTEFLAVVLGGLYVMEAMSDVIQVGYFKMTHKRVFKMAPIHHHFELEGWTETKVVVRFWMIELIFVLLALTIFYGDWVTRSGLLFS